MIVVQGNRGFASGGLISEPSWLVSMRTGRLWGSIAERAPELVVPLGGAGGGSRGAGSVTVNVTVNVAGSVHTERSLVDAIKRALYEEARLQTQFAF